MTRPSKWIAAQRMAGLAGCGCGRCTRAVHIAREPLTLPVCQPPALGRCSYRLMNPSDHRGPGQGYGARLVAVPDHRQQSTNLRAHGRSEQIFMLADQRGLDVRGDA